LEDACVNSTISVDEDGIMEVATMLEASDSDDWWYIVVGGQTSLKRYVPTLFAITK